MAKTIGTVKWFNESKGYGFIEQESGKDLFAHHSAIIATGFRTLKDGERVEFNIVEDQKGLKAVDIVALSPPSA